MDAMAKGMIPNPLMGTVIELFEGKISKENIKDTEERYKKLYDGLSFFCQESMVEPTYDEVEAIIPLTDNQRFTIYRFATDGIMPLAPSTKK